jgi:hypothetical protein
MFRNLLLSTLLTLKARKPTSSLIIQEPCPLFAECIRTFLVILGINASPFPIQCWPTAPLMAMQRVICEVGNDILNIV